MKKFFAFTLTEVLITLAVVGVVSILTLPNVMASHQKRVQVASLQRLYNTIINATAEYMRVNEVDDLSYSNIVTQEGIQEFFENYFDVLEVCTPMGENSDNAYKCLAESYTASDKSMNFAPRQIHYGDSFTVCAILTSGPVLCLERLDQGEPLFYLHIDTNGAQKPNIAGRDFFGRLRLWSDGKIMGYRYDSHTIYMCPDEGGAPLTLTATGCFARIQRDGWEMKY